MSAAPSSSHNVSDVLEPAYLRDDEPVLYPREDLIEDKTEIAVLIVVASIGMVSNFAVLILILVLHNLRRASNAFLFHQCLLDLLKAAYCLPFAHTMVADEPPIYCGMLGASYIVFVTTSSFNLLAIVMNEAYQFADLMLGVKDSRNYCCVIFGVFIIWFSSLIMNLGVAFIPGNPSYDRRIGHCIFIYGVTRNYVLHLLWIVLISLALGLTIVYLWKLHLDIKRSSYYRLTTLIRHTVNIDAESQTLNQRKVSEFRDKNHIKWVLNVTRKKWMLMILLLVLFFTFWYPLFLLTAADPGFTINPDCYKGLTIFAWSNPTVTPIVLVFFIKTNCCCNEGGVDLVAIQDAMASEQEAERTHQMATCSGQSVRGVSRVVSRGASLDVPSQDDSDSSLNLPPPPDIASDPQFRKSRWM